MRLFAVLTLAALATPAIAQDVPIATYRVNLPNTCNDSTPATRCVLATPVVNPDGTNIGAGGGGSSGAVGQGSSATTATGPMVQGRVVSGDQTYAADTVQPFNLTGTGRLKVGTSYTTNVTPAAIPSTTTGAALVACQYRATPTTWADTNTGSFRCGPDGAIAVGGTVPSGATSIGNPMLTGCDVLTSPPTVATGTRAPLLCTLRNSLLTSLIGTTGAQAQIVQATDSQGQNNALFVNSYNLVYNPGTATWNFGRGDTTGQFVVPRAASNLTTAQVSVGTTATLIIAARTAPNRSRLIITQSAAGPCYYGPTSAVSATTGARLTIAAASKTYQYSGALYGICPGGAVTVDYDEEF